MCDSHQNGTGNGRKPGARPGIQAMRTAEGLAPGLSLLTAGTAGRNPAEHAQTLTDAGRRFRAVTVQPRQFIANGAG